jgi:hypothetical protein
MVCVIPDFFMSDAVFHSILFVASLKSSLHAGSFSNAFVFEVITSAHDHLSVAIVG